MPAPYKAPLRAFASLVIPWQLDKILLAHIGDRGWCIPSGRVEAGETSIEAARREAEEEVGAHLKCLQYIGCYRILDRNEVKWADLYVAKVDSLCEITMPEESLGRQFVSMDELPGIYYCWNELTEAVFRFSQEIISRTCG